MGSRSSQLTPASPYSLEPGGREGGRGKEREMERERVRQRT